MRRTITLARETLSDLSDGDLSLVAGGQTLTGLYPTVPVQWCVIEIVTILPDPA